MTDAATGTLESVERGNEFVRRHIGPSDAEKAAMLETLGLSSLDALIDAAVPASIRRARPLALARARSEADVLAALAERAARNGCCRSFIGAGFYGTHTPAVIRRNVLESPGWYTAYTPYQPEISQGRLEALLGFQTAVADLTGMDVANASMLDEPTAAAEAMTLALRVGKSESRRFFVAADVHPQTLAVVRTRARPLGIEIVAGDPERDLEAAGVFGVLLQYPGTTGAVVDLRGVVEAVHAAGGIVACATDLLACCVLVPPGELGADVVVGSAQRFGVPFGFGGPHAGFLATRDAHMRSLPGRLVGVSRDAEGRDAYRLALQTREQHIRREKATSNICTAQVLLAAMAGLYAVYHGPEGLEAIARRVHRLTAILKAGLERLGWDAGPAHFFDTLAIAAADRAPAVLAAARAAGINLRDAGGGTIGISLDETATRADVERLWQAFSSVDRSSGGAAGLDVDALDRATPDGLPAALVRESAYLTHPVFAEHRSETKMLRYLRALADRDITLNRSMIPLGSCTMKLNGTTEMLPISWPGFADVHPLVPDDQAAGYLELIGELEAWLCEITGMDACSVQPNAGSQGELAGLLAIRAHHAARGDGGRDVCLIPSSAHGTNPASARMCGMRTVVVACDQAGNIDVSDLEAKAAEHAGALAALMVTYPSTHGVYEARIAEICEIVHAHGGQVYLDGANLNALVGIAAPGEFGADVLHMNLHKTFCIPHGGGGPGVGPIAVKRHLAPFLPSRDYAAEDQPVGPVSGSAYGSAGILPISWAYIALMGAEGLTEATRTAILSANYVARRLAPHYPVLYAGQGGYVAQECIVDLRPLKEASGVTVEDVAKRLMDYGFHAPTVSFPVAGTLMIEPTESEAKDELDRFCDAMIAIRREIADIESGAMPRDDNPLKNAPHTATMLTADDWTHPYSRAEAAYPLPWIARDKYWPPVARIDQVYGDRNPFCACPPVSDEAQ